MLVEITEEDIKNGIKTSHDSCPVALALKRCLNNRTVRVGTKLARWDSSNIKDYKDKIQLCGYTYTLDLPDRIQRFINMFDNNVDVSPTSFEIEEENVN